jgi:dienelactone hydrolase
MISRFAVAVALVLAAACSSGGGDAAEPTTSAPAPAPEPPFAVGRRTLELIDRSRPTDAYAPASVAAQPDRTIEVHLVYPSEGRGFPLVVWAHGWNGTNDRFLPLAERWAREGYVVALPEFPLSREGIANGDDVQNQPGDVSFVIDEVLDLGIADGDRVAVGGHSLGAATVFGVAFNTCCLDDRIDAAIAVSGGGLVFEGGEYLDRDTVPLLLVHGARDAGVPVGVGDATFRNQPPPITYLRLTEADHVNVFSGANASIFNRAVLAFLDAELRDEPGGMESLPAAVRSSGRATLQTK